MVWNALDWIDFTLHLVTLIIGGSCLFLLVLLGIGFLVVRILVIRMDRERARLLPNLTCPFCQTRYGNPAAEKALLVYKHECRQFELRKKEYEKNHPTEIVKWMGPMLTIRCPECWRLGGYDPRTKSVIDSGFVENPPVKPDLSRQNMKN